MVTCLPLMTRVVGSLSSTSIVKSLVFAFLRTAFFLLKKRQFSQNSVVLDQNNEWEKQCKIDNIHINSTSLTCEKLAELEMFVFQEPCPGWGQVEPGEN